MATTFTPSRSESDAGSIWSPAHGEFDRGLALSRVESFAEQLQRDGSSVSDGLFEQTVERIEDAYDHFELEEPKRELEGGHAFLVPTRATHTELHGLREAYNFIPLLRGIDDVPKDALDRSRYGVLALRLLEILPPNIIDRYKEVNGAIVYTPITAMLPMDMSSTPEAVGTARRIVSQTVAYAGRLGAEVIGLGATLPSLTNYGRAIPGAEDYVLTTGHGGTAWLAGNIALNAFREGGSDGSIGVVGLGAMGSALVDTVRDMLPNVPLSVYDINDKLALRTKLRLTGQVNIADSVQDVLRGSNVVISALTSPVDLSGVPRSVVEGTIIIDDSQPGAFSREQVHDLGGRLLWVVGRSNNGFSRSSNLNFGGTVMSERDLFGCEAEAAVIAALPLSERKSRAITQAATVEQIREIGRLLDKNHIVPGDAQSYGLPA